MKTGDMIFGLPVEIVEIPDMPTCATCRIIDDSDPGFHGWLADRIESQIAVMLEQGECPMDGLEFRASANQPIVTFYADGRIEIDSKFTASDAAREFWTAIFTMRPKWCDEAQLAKITQRLTELRELAEVDAYGNVHISRADLDDAIAEIGEMGAK